MHLSMSSPTYPRSGRGGDLQMLDDTLGTTSSCKFPTNSYYLFQESLTIWPSMAVCVANAPTLGTSLGDESPPTSQSGSLQPGVGEA